MKSEGKEGRNSYQRAYYQKNKEKLKEYQRDYTKRNRGVKSTTKGRTNRVSKIELERPVIQDVVTHSDVQNSPNVAKLVTRILHGRVTLTGNI